MCELRKAKVSGRGTGGERKRKGKWRRGEEGGAVPLLTVHSGAGDLFHLPGSHARGYRSSAVRLEMGKHESSNSAFLYQDCSESLALLYGFWDELVNVRVGGALRF